jgi:hypothetical protein
MGTKTRILLIVAVMVASALTASAQMAMGARPPEIRGVWNPVVGSGGAYQTEAKGERKTEMEIAVVGKETVEGKPGYWLEMAMKDPGGEGNMYIKHLIVLDGKQTQIKRMIMQPPGQPPLEMPIDSMQARGRATERPADIRDQAERVGSESVTTPAGTFTCERWHMKDGSAELWVSEKVAPYGLVKMTGRDSNMTLVRVITNAKTRITGTPQKFDPMEMMRRQMNKE